MKKKRINSRKSLEKIIKEFESLNNKKGETNPDLLSEFIKKEKEVDIKKNPKPDFNKAKIIYIILIVGIFIAIGVIFYFNLESFRNLLIGNITNSGNLQNLNGNLNDSNNLENPWPNPQDNPTTITLSNKNENNINNSVKNKTKTSGGGGSSDGGGSSGGSSSSGGGTTCIPNCFGKTCGSDGCSGSCGTCNENETCVNDTECSELVNIAPFATITTTPYGDFLHRLADGNPGTGVTMLSAYILARSYEFRFSQVQKVSKIRFTLASKNYTIQADTTGNGTYDKELFTDSNYTPGVEWGVPEWIYTELNESSISLYAIKIIVTPPQDRTIFDFQILSAKDYVDPRFNSSIDLESNVSDISEGNNVSIDAPFDNETYTKGINIEPWMFDWNGWITSSPRGNLSDWPAYINMITAIKSLHVNLVWLMPLRAGSDCYNGPVPWPSDYINDSSPENYLKILADTLHSDGIKIFAEDRPYPGWIPKNSSDPGYGNRPIIPGGVAEMAASGVDGVAISYDEDPNQDRGPLAKAVTDAVKAVNPNITTISNLVIMESYATYDQIGHSADVDKLGTEGYFTLEDPYGHWTPAINTVRMIGANPHRQTIITLNAPWASGGGDDGRNGPGNNPLFYDTFPPVAMYGAILSNIMHGGNAMSFWRLWDMLYYNGYNNYTATGYDMLDTLARWGAKNATVPDQILVLDSNYANNAYYEIAAAYKDSFPLQPWQLETRRGFDSSNAVMEMLFSAGLPFQVRYADYPTDIINLTKPKIIIIPLAYTDSYGESWPRGFPSSIISSLESAASNGTKIIILGKNGTISNDFYNLTLSPNVTVLQDDIIHGVTSDIKSSFLNAVNNSLKDNRPTYLNNYGNDIELGELEKNDTEKFLFLTNWENHNVTADVGIKVSEGNYTMIERDLINVRNISINGKNIFTKSDLAKFRVNLDKDEAKIFYIVKEN